MHTNRVIGQANLLKYYPLKNYIDTEDWNIGLIVLLEELEEEYKYSTVVNTKLNELMKNYTFIREVKSDGNSLYRAVIFHYLEKIIINGRDQIANFINLIAYPNDRGYLDLHEEEPKVKEILFGHLYQILLTSQKSNEAAYHLFQKIIIYSPYFDWALIRLLKRMVANYIKNELEGTHLQIKDIVEENGRFDPSEHMEIITEIMGRMLGVNLVTITTDLYDTRNKEFYITTSCFPTQINEYPSTSIFKSDWNICILLNGGIYSILYESSQTHYIQQFSDISQETVQKSYISYTKNPNIITSCCNSQVDRIWYRKEIHKLAANEERVELNCCFCNKMLDTELTELLLNTEFILQLNSPQESKKRFYRDSGHSFYEPYYAPYLPSKRNAPQIPDLLVENNEIIDLTHCNLLRELCLEQELENKAYLSAH